MFDRKPAIRQPQCHRAAIHRIAAARKAAVHCLEWPTSKACQPIFTQFLRSLSIVLLGHNPPFR